MKHPVLVLLAFRGAHQSARPRCFSEAEAMQQQAIAVARQEQTVASTDEQELQKIKKRTLRRACRASANQIGSGRLQSVTL